MHEMQTVGTDVPIEWCVCQSVRHGPAPSKNGLTHRGSVGLNTAGDQLDT